MISPKTINSLTPRRLSLAKLQTIPQEQSFLVRSSLQRQSQNHSRRVSHNQVTSPLQKECKTLLELYKQMTKEENSNGQQSERSPIKIKSPTQQSLSNLKPLTYITKDQPLIIKHINASKQTKHTTKTTKTTKSNSCFKKGRKVKRHVEFKNSIKIVNLADGRISNGRLNDGVKPLLRYQKTLVLIEDL